MSRDFARLWAAETASAFGDAVTGIALPLIAISTLAASAIELGVLAALFGLPFLVLSLPVGAMLDRGRKRPVLIATDLGRAAVLVAVPLAATAGLLSMPLLFVVALLVGILAVPFGIAQRSYLPFVVPRERLVEANSRLEVTLAAAQVIGPGVGGMLVAALGAPRAILADCLSYLASALLVRGIRAVEPEPPVQAARRMLGREIADGIGYVARQPVLRALVLSGGLANAAFAMWTAVYLLFLVRELGFDAVTIGVVLGLSNIGLAVAAPLIGRLTRRLGLGRALIVGQVLRGVTILLIPLALVLPSAALLVAVGICASFSALLYLVNQRSLRQAITPDELQGRVTASTLVVTLGLTPVGSLLGGAVAQSVGLVAVFVLGGIVGLAAVVPLLAPVIRTRRQLVDEPAGS